MYVLKKFNTEQTKLVYADRLITTHVKEPVPHGTTVTIDNVELKEVTRTEATWIFYNNAFSKVAAFPDKDHDIPIFSLFATPLDTTVPPGAINILSFSSFFDITEYVSDSCLRHFETLDQIWSEAVTNAGLKKILTTNEYTDTNLEVTCDFHTYSLLISRYASKVIVIKKDGCLLALGMIVLDKDETTTPILSKPEREIEDKIVGDLKANLVTNHMQSLGIDPKALIAEKARRTRPDMNPNIGKQRTLGYTPSM